MCPLPDGEDCKGFQKTLRACPLCHRPMSLRNGVEEEGFCSDSMSQACSYFSWRRNPHTRDDTEIERRFLLTYLPGRVFLGTIDAYSYMHGFLPGPGHIRERLTFRTREPYFKRTVKIGKGLVRKEFSEDLTGEQFQLLWGLTKEKRLRGTRWTISDPQQGLQWEVSLVTAGKKPDRVVAEIEIPHKEVQVKIPEWLGPYVVRDVTDEEEYEAWNFACPENAW